MNVELNVEVCRLMSLITQHHAHCDRILLYENQRKVPKHFKRAYSRTLAEIYEFAPPGCTLEELLVCHRKWTEKHVCPCCAQERCVKHS